MNHIERLVLETAQRGELHHAVILHGPDATALRELAVRAAKALNCLNRTTGDDCLSCQRIERRMHPDVHVTDVGDDRKMISVEQVRDIVAEASLRPYEGRTKVFIIDPADAISVSGSNSLLKTLEEPTRDTNFILLTRSADLLLPTIRSRSQSLYVGGEEPRDDELEQFASSAIDRFLQQRDSTALLGLAATVAGRDPVKDAIARVASILVQKAANVGPDAAADRTQILAAADAMLEAIRWQGVNADAKLVVERALARLAIRTA